MPPTRTTTLALSQLRGEEQPILSLWNDSRIASCSESMPPMTPFLTIPPVLEEDCAAKKGPLNPYEHTGHENIFYTAPFGGLRSIS